MLPREFDRRVLAYHEQTKAREEAEWHRMLMLFNRMGNLITAFSGKKIPVLTLEDLKRKAKSKTLRGEAPTPEEIEMALRQIEEVWSSKKASA